MTAPVRVHGAANIMRVGLGLGSNLGDRLANLRRARGLILGLHGVERGHLSAPLYETDPVDCPPDSAAFLNSVLEIGAAEPFDPLRILADLRRIEEALGRPSRHPRNAPRSIDLDILYADALVLHTPVLTLPHPRLRERRFVLEPLAAIRPELVLRGEEKSISELLRDLGETGSVRQVEAAW